MTWVRISAGHAKVTRFNPKALGLGALAVVIVGAVIAFVIGSIGVPDRVERLTVENQTEFPLEVEISRADAESWLGVGVVGSGETKQFNRVIDQGEVWVFRFGGQGETSSHLRYTRQELSAEGWRLVIPPSVGDELRAAGVEPPP